MTRGATWGRNPIFSKTGMFLFYALDLGAACHSTSTKTFSSAARRNLRSKFKVRDEGLKPLGETRIFRPPNWIFSKFLRNFGTRSVSIVALPPIQSSRTLVLVLWHAATKLLNWVFLTPDRVLLALNWVASLVTLPPIGCRRHPIA